MNAYRVVISEQDGMGGGKDVDYYFEEYDDAHDFYVYIKSLKGTSFHPSVSKPPTEVEVPMPKIYKKGEKTGWQK